jgi:5-methyltetrahydrofolate--homocysteine methyltransferase
LPLLIGGATTSRIHTAVKVAPNYSGTVVHVLDASRSVPVAGSLLSDGQKEAFSENIKLEYKRLAEEHAKRQTTKDILSFDDAKLNAGKFNFTENEIQKPAFLGIKTIDFNLAELRETIDWTPFFQTWELAGKYPAILNDEKVGNEARKLFDDANNLLNGIISRQLIQAKGIFFILPANRVGEDIDVYADENRSEIKTTFHFLRQQRKMGTGVSNLSLCDFVAEKNTPDYMGGFAVTAGIGLDILTAAYEKDHDDYNSILAKALADRLAESAAEFLHREIRTKYWAYAANENINNEDLIRENYRGIRPAPGYPACPEHTEKRILFDLMEVEKHIPLELTESMAMWPAAAVSGFYFAHPESQYFGLGKINKDQVEDYAHRKNWDLATAEKWLRPVLAY